MNEEGEKKVFLSCDHYMSIESYAEGLARFERKGKYGYLNLDGDIVIMPEFEDCSSYSDGLACASMDGHTYVYIDQAGEVSIKSDQYWIDAAFSEGLAMVRTKQLKTAYIDRKGQIVIPPRMETGWFFSEGMTYIYDPLYQKYGYMDKQGNMVISCAYDSATSFYEGIAFVTRDHTVIAINAQGEHLYSLPKYVQIDIQEYTYHPELLSIRLDQDDENIVYIRRNSGERIYSYTHR